MPIYEYVCPTCGLFEEMRKVSDPPLAVCPRGHAGVERKMSASGFILKGSGWYVTDYARKAANGAGGKRDGASADTPSADKAARSEKSGAGKASDSSSDKTSKTGAGSGG